MEAATLTALVLVLLVLSTSLRAWLALRQIRHVHGHRNEVPAEFSDRIGLPAHQRAAQYTIARAQLGVVELVVSMALFLGFTILGGIDAIQSFWSDLTGVTDEAGVLRDGAGAALGTQMLIAGSIFGLMWLVSLPFDFWRVFVLEARFGFNRMPLGLFIGDLVKGLVLGIALGAPLLAAILWLMARAGELWWLWAWLVWAGFNLAALIIYPQWIAPLFNRFEPLEQGPVRTRVETLLQRCGFKSSGLFVMDGSRRSTHGNAYFTGFGRSKRIVFFDTLLSRLDIDEIEAVLAHELGHFRMHHVLRRIAVGFTTSLVGLALVAWLMKQRWFFEGLGVSLSPSSPVAPIVALILVMLTMPIVSFVIQPLFTRMSRRHEYEADAFAAEHTAPRKLISALVKLYEDNASTLTPDPVHSRFHDSHPPATLRIGALERIARQG